MNWPIRAADLRKELQYKADQGDTTELDLFAAAAVERIEEKIGKVSGQIITATATGPTDRVRMHNRVVTLESITIDGQPADVGSYTLSLGGIVRGPFPAGNIEIRAIAPQTDSSLVILATRRLAALWWQQAKNGPRGANTTAADLLPGIMGVGIPRVVESMLEAKPDLPAFA